MKISELGPFSIKDGGREPPKATAPPAGVFSVSQTETPGPGKENPDQMKAGRLISLIAEAKKRLGARKAKQGLAKKKAIEAYQRVVDFESDDSALGMRLDVKV